MSKVLDEVGSTSASTLTLLALCDVVGELDSGFGRRDERRAEE